jgi:uncharacterized protein involved in cysteine biosynthesis
VIQAFLLSVAQLGDRRVLRVLALSLGVTLLLFVGLGGVAWWGTQAALAAWTGAQAGAIATAFAIFVTVLAAWLLFRAVAVAVVGLFADGVVEAVEARHYPDALASARPLPLHQGIAMGLRSALRVVAVNLVMLPIYIALLVTGVGTAAAFFLVNGWLLGRDLGDMVASRHLGAERLKAWRSENKGRRLLLGLAGTGLFVVPVLNLLAPVLGAAMATHLYHRRRS